MLALPPAVIAKALPSIVRLVRARDYRFVTLAGIRPPH